MPMQEILGSLFDEESMRPFLLVAIHAGKNRKLEYGTAGEPDYQGRGNQADRYDRFLLQELLPFIHAQYPQTAAGMLSLAGFSLGGLTAMDMAWRHPDVFQSVGVFSGSFWWRSLAQEDPLYSDAKHRIMHQRVRMGEPRRHQRFFFQCGALDEQLDRNRNGIIDSIDDTLDLIEELKAKGISRATNMYYLELADGKHDVETWSRALPFFLRWNFGQ